MNQPVTELELKRRIIKSGKVLLDINYQLGSDPLLQDTVYGLETEKDVVNAFDDLAESDPEEAIRVLKLAIDVLFHGYQMHSAKDQLARLRDRKS
jgi:hypothetical protein